MNNVKRKMLKPRQKYNQKSYNCGNMSNAYISQSDLDKRTF